MDAGNAGVCAGKAGASREVRRSQSGYLSSEPRPCCQMLPKEVLTLTGSMSNRPPGLGGRLMRKGNPHEVDAILVRGLVPRQRAQSLCMCQWLFSIRDMFRILRRTNLHPIHPGRTDWAQFLAKGWGGLRHGVRRRPRGRPLCPCGGTTWGMGKTVCGEGADRVVQNPETRR